MLKNFEIKKGNLLDVGCGKGRVLKYFADQGWKVKGIDFSEFGIETHHMGSVNVQLRKSNNKYYVFEINPRISNTIKFRVQLGFNDAL